MQAVMLSIHPKWVEKISAGWKTLELRKTVPNLPRPFKCYIYQTKHRWAFKLLRSLKLYNLADRLAIGFGKVIGEFVCDHILGHCEMANADIAEQQSRVRRDKILEYSGGKEVYGWHISDLMIYSKPRELQDFIVPSKIGCCNEGKCRGCNYFDRGNDFNIEHDCVAQFSTDEFKPLRRPPQSWCYVEEVPRNG